MTPKRAVVLLSGGLDSSTTLALAREDGFVCHALAFRYGQRHAVELEHARDVAQALGAAELRVVDIDLREFGGSALTADIDVPKERAPAGIGADVPITYVPARNTIFLSFALGLCEVLEAHDIFLGANALDYSGYPDCRPEFLESFERTANLGTRMGVEARNDAERVRVRAPLLRLTKAQIIREGVRLGVDYGRTWSCYDPQGTPARACGGCDACVLRRKGFQEAGVADPTPYALPSAAS